DVVFVGVNIQDKEPAARAFLEAYGITYPNVIDEGNRVAIDYGICGIPETFFIDREGRITYKHVGALGWETITAELDEALAGVVSAIEGRGDYRPVQGGEEW
ncbi:MAG: TlpA family protein disulfide reductase, partial [Candidatus Rokubacteria bacterium]|nr:TlpA family protein disulfide reductase [Candidatus Rokubacteria bacterium]